MKALKRSESLARLSRRDYVGTDRPLAVWRVADPQPDVLHGHDYLELQIITAGSATHRDPGGRRTVRRGDALLLRPGAAHAYAEVRRLGVYVVCLAPELLRHELRGVMDDRRLHALLRGGPGVGSLHEVQFLKLGEAALRRCEPVLARLASQRGAAWSQTGVGQLGGLLLVLQELSGALPDGAAGGGGGGGGSGIHPAVSRAAGLLEAEPAAAWDLSTLAAAVRLNEAYFCRLFRRQTGVSPMTYLAQRRGELAASLLHTGRTIQEVAVEVGWPEPSYFARRFRALFGVSASAYREGIESGK